MTRTPTVAQEFRRRAEELARTDEDAALQTLTLDDAKLLFHELRVHQVELEMQNEELRRTQHELELSRTRYFELYDLAPVGYMTLSERGLIQKANITVATMLGVARKDLLQKPVSKYIFSEDQDLYYLHRKKLLSSCDLQEWEMRMVRADGSCFWAILQSIPSNGTEHWITLVDISKRKQAEEELRKKNELLSLFIKHSPIFAFIKEVTPTESRVLEASDNFQQMVGIPGTEMAGKTTSELFPPDFADKINADDRVVVSVGKVLQQEENFNGRCYTTIKFPIFQDDKVILAGYTIDLTERKQAESVLQARLRISDYALDHSLDELLTKALDEAELLTGSKVSFFNFVDADQKTLTLQTWSTNTLSTFCNAETKGLHYQLESAGVWADCIRERKSLVHNNYESLPNRKGLPPGHVPLLRELVVPIFRNDLIVAVLGVGNKPSDYTVQEKSTLNHLANLIWDIIIRKQTEESLKSTELKYCRLFESMTDAYVYVDMEGRIVESNASFQKMTGYNPEELSDLTYLQLTPEKWQKYEADITEQQVLVRGYSDVYQKGYRRKDGTIIDVELKTFLLKDEAGKPTGMWAIIRDITDRKLAEHELQQAKEASEAANRAKSDFLATMSHEIRTPLGAMLGNIELLEGSALTPQQQECLKDCKYASHMLLQVINDVLDFSKIEAGKLELANMIFSVSSMARQLVRMFNAAARQKDLDLAVSLAKDLPEYILGDQQRIQQIIANLISNALKFTTLGAVSLKIFNAQSPTATNPDKAVLCIEVSDTGIGIAPDKQEHIFEKFTQVENFSTRSASGTGLGLPICRRLLALMGGSITVSSVPGEGSTFTVVLPVTVGEPPVQAQTQVKVKAHSRKILIADDDDRGRTVAQKLLQRMGYKVTAVENGAKLLDALQKETFDIVLTDISMPDMVGTQVACIIRSGDRVGINPRIPIIAMTAHAYADDRERFKAAGINGYVAKPVNIAELLRQIEELCNKSDE
jgi:PAS domain S-box-containing protein